MPKIPTFTRGSNNNNDVGSVQSNIQMGLNQTIGAALAPVTKEIVAHKVKQKDFENKTEALKLENDFLEICNQFTLKMVNILKKISTKYS